MHPECAAYSAAGCPVMTGAATHYRSAPHPVTAAPGEQPARLGRTVEPFFAVWMNLGDYRVGADKVGKVGIILSRRPLKVRPLNAAARDIESSLSLVRRVLDLEGAASAAEP
jgi:hypothetical protein